MPSFFHQRINAGSARLIVITSSAQCSPTETVESDISIWANGDFSIWRLHKRLRGDHPRQEMATVLTDLLPKRLARTTADTVGGPERIADFSDRHLASVAAAVKQWRVRPNGTEGYRTAEVTLGGVDTSGLSSKTFESRSVPGLYFIGEVVDVTGHLGGFNFQWAWASGVAAGRAL